MNCSNYLFRFFLYFASVAFVFGCKENKEQSKLRQIILPENLDIIEIDNSVSFDKSWFSKKLKVVVFIKKAGPYSTLDLDWMSAISEYHRNIAFLFYVSEPDRNKLVNHLKEVNFIHPVIHDPDEVFRKLNVKENDLTFISFLIRDDNIVGMSNPSFTDFKKKLEELFK